MMRNARNTVLRTLIVSAACLTLAAGYADTIKPSPVQDKFPGYLTPETAPNSEILLPPPPAENSAAFALDQDISRKSLVLKDSKRWALAAEDANLNFPAATRAFSCAMDAPITEQDTPHLYLLLRRVLSDAKLATSKAKNKYSRTRPFVINKKPTCSPDSEAFLRKNGSYPSGHSTVGWAWALILSEISPERANAILARGRAFGQNRMICNVHWQSDVIEGRFMGSATVARLHADPVFRAELELAKAEVAIVRAKGLKPLRDCKAECDALAEFPPDAPWPANK